MRFKGYFIYIIIGIIWGCDTHEAAKTLNGIEGDSIVGWHTSEHDSAIESRALRVAAELGYYLERHTENDEGYDMVARYAAQGDSALGYYMPRQPLSLRNVGHWRCLPRSGTGLVVDALGRLVIGTFADDTLVGGIRLDKEGVYAGRLTRNAEASGHGAYRSLDDSYYEGQWSMDMRQGFGFCVSPSFLHAGHWRRNRFIGERMHYTPDRIYGIDISRYQHEGGRKRRYNIDWQHLRITSLGHLISEQRVSGVVDYPVSFAYIKSTEGISIKNQYFHADHSAAHANGIPVGAYHFFSTKQSASAQATFFLQNSLFRRGDLPPMLDVEPTDGMIKAMGGPEVLFRQLRVWLKQVENQLGIRPILYVNQSFAKKYLDQAPDMKRDYQVWIARYGEYKPHLHLTFWQLSADGRVRGIQSSVDINVFNGNQAQWDDFLRLETFR